MMLLRKIFQVIVSIVMYNIHVWPTDLIETFDIIPDLLYLPAVQ